MIFELFISAAVSAGVALCMPRGSRRRPKTTVRRLQRRPATRHGHMPERQRSVVDEVAETYQPSAVYVPGDDYPTEPIGYWTDPEEYSEVYPARPFVPAPAGAPEGVMPPV